MASPKLTDQQIEDIVQLRAEAPHTHRNLTYPGGVKFLRERIALEIEHIPADATYSTEVVLRDEGGHLVLDANGKPQFVKVTRFRREHPEVARELRTLLANLQAEWRAYLTRSNEQHQREAKALQAALASEFKENRSSPDCSAEIAAYSRAWIATPDELRADFETAYAAGAGPHPLRNQAQAAE
jgi:hypothetical protein